jgi:hypothetical protein
MDRIRGDESTVIRPVTAIAASEPERPIRILASPTRTEASSIGETPSSLFPLPRNHALLDPAGNFGVNVGGLDQLFFVARHVVPPGEISLSR